MSGPAYVSISPVLRQPRRTACGIPIGLASEAAYLGADLTAAFVSILAVPPSVAAASDVTAWQIATLTHLVEASDLSFVSVWSPTFFLELLEVLPGLSDKVTARLTPKAQSRLAGALTGPRLDTDRLWPKLDTISCWTDGSSRGFAHQLQALCPQASIEPKGLLATEAAITLPWGASPGAVPALLSAFIEFIDAAGEARLAHELRLDAQYRVIVTTAGGLYRYDMGDQVRCVGHEGKIGQLVFEGRTSLVSDMVGEKLDEAFLAQVLGELAVGAALVPRTKPKPHYELWLDVAGGDLGAAESHVDHGLRKNPQYAYARDIGQLGAVAAIAKPGFTARRNFERANAGRRMGDLKPAALIMDDR